MKLTIDDDHREYFRHNHCVEFEEVLFEEEIFGVYEAIRDALAQRLDISPEKVLKLPAPKLFESGRDLWRDATSLREFVCRRALGEVAFQLTGRKPLRLGYDQFLPIAKSSAFPLEDRYAQWLQSPGTLSEGGSLQGVVCGVLLCLSPEPSNVTFLAPEGILNFLEDFPIGDHAYYLIVYTRANSVYLCNKQDPHGQELLRRGYYYGDRLTDEGNPIAYR